MKKVTSLIVGPLLCASSLMLLSLSACGTDVHFSSIEVQKRLTLDSSTNVWINEFHYDNAGGDVAEGVEIAGEAGTDLSGYSIVLYNGSSSSGASYKTEDLSGVIPDEGSGSEPSGSQFQASKMVALMVSLLLGLVVFFNFYPMKAPLRVLVG